MNRDQYEKAHRLMLERLPWEQKQRAFSIMRHGGLRRKHKAFPTAADNHYPVIDMAIRKQKPFWLGQIMSGNRLASFVSITPQADTLAEAAADWFNFRVFQKSNFLQKMRSVVDTMLLRGRGVLKITTDPFNDNALVFEAVDPMFLLVPDMADDLKDADEFVHIQQWTLGRYQRNRRFDQSPDTVRQIRGVEQMDTLLQYVRDKQLREGITHSTNAYVIILWEHWVKTDNGWTVYTYSPPKIPNSKFANPLVVPTNSAAVAVAAIATAFQQKAIRPQMVAGPQGPRCHSFRSRRKSKMKAGIHRAASVNCSPRWKPTSPNSGTKNPTLLPSAIAPC